MVFDKYGLTDTSLPQNDEEGGKQKKCEILEQIGQIINEKLPDVSDIMEDFESRLISIKRTDVPYFLNPKTATFTDVAIHAHVRQGLGPSTIEKHLRYARMMETHACPIDFRNLTPEGFLRHMDYRIEHEDATANALYHEKKAILMFLKAFRLYTEDWDKYVKTPRIRASESHRNIVIPLPSIVNKLYHAEYSSDEYENVLFQSVTFFGFNFGPRPPSEICNLDVPDLIIYDDGKGYVILTEDKKHGIRRRVYPWDPVVLSSKVYRTPKNYRDTWRPLVYEEEKSGLALFLQPNGKRITGNYLRTHIAPIFKEISQDSSMILYDMRHTYGTYMYELTKDIKKVAKSLGHEKTQNVDHYMFISEEIEKQVKEKRQDLFHQALRQSCNNDGGKLGEKGDTCKKNLSISANLSERDKWACPNLNRSL
jgi:integrase